MNATTWLGYAEPAGSADAGMKRILAGAALLVVVAAMAFVTGRVANARRHRRESAVWLAAVVWGVASASLAVQALITQSDWSREQTLRLQSGYYNPQQAAADAPSLPWALAAGLVGAYALLLGWALVGRTEGSGVSPAGSGQTIRQERFRR